VAESARWVDVLDPDQAQLDEALPRKLADRVVERILEPHTHEDEPRPTLESHGEYVFGVFVVAVDEPKNDRIYYQEINVVVTRDLVLTVRKTPPDGKPFDPEEIREACAQPKAPGMIAYHVVDTVAERYLDLIDDLNDEIDELEDNVDEWPAAR